jgi:leucyl/phenylalanyl-tRNA--protein transferase
MFHRVSNASKIALVSLVKILDRMDFKMVDCQVSSSHLKSMGAREIPRVEFLNRLDDALGDDHLRNKWSKFENYK